MRHSLKRHPRHELATALRKRSPVMSATVVPEQNLCADDASEPPVTGRDRADAPVSLVAERFLRAILVAVPFELLEEVHLFSPLRQGVTETGIAVVAAREVVQRHEIPDAPLALSPELSLDVEPMQHNEPVLEIHGALDDVSPYADETSESDAVAPPAPRVRHTIYTARYRLVIKGAERGKWEADVVAEAEAPLITVETVVRGVQRRAGEDSAITRFSAAQVAHALRRHPTDVAASS